MLIKKNKAIAITLCLFLGAIGGHFFYLGKWDDGFRRLGLFFIINPYCFYHSIKDAYRLIKMDNYTFYTYCTLRKVKGTETRTGLHEHLTKIKNSKL